jgi:NAD(P)-dependent dehydrogenase (short-subunit alcohol dehydrogenase family)
MVGPQSFQGDPAYVASKGGLEALMRVLAVELGDKGIAAPPPGTGVADTSAASNLRRSCFVSHRLLKLLRSSVRPSTPQASREAY